MPAAGIVAVDFCGCGAVLLVYEDGFADFHCVVEDFGVCGAAAGVEDEFGVWAWGWLY